uniref:Uncharacterized protein n=1 Tax=Fagus sylvatica TaxID=28930 RepID=A0A2N9G937_FAGSY
MVALPIPAHNPHFLTRGAASRPQLRLTAARPLNLSLLRISAPSLSRFRSSLAVTLSLAHPPPRSHTAATQRLPHRRNSDPLSLAHSATSISHRRYPKAPSPPQLRSVPHESRPHFTK